MVPATELSLRLYLQCAEVRSIALLLCGNALPQKWLHMCFVKSIHICFRFYVLP